MAEEYSSKQKIKKTNISKNLGRIIGGVGIGLLGGFAADNINSGDSDLSRYLIDGMVSIFGGAVGFRFVGRIGEYIDMKINEQRELYEKKVRTRYTFLD